jgi:hypothetical protein
MYAYGTKIAVIETRKQELKILKETTKSSDRRTQGGRSLWKK